MFLKNWDVSQLFGVVYAITGRLPEEDREICYRTTSGEARSEGLDSAKQIQIQNWGNYYYSDKPNNTNNSYDNNWFLWPGGDIDGQPARIRPVMNRDIVRYEDFDLYSPFYGTVSPDPNVNTIYGQNHIVSSPIYNKELDQWERTVTREFKNESGKIITVRELGVYGYLYKLVAREILDTPIEVANDSYFKISWTYKVENPHENRQVKRIRQYSLPQHNYWGDNSSQTHPLTVEKKKLLLLRQYSLYSTNNRTDEQVEEYYQNLTLTLSGWTNKHLGHFSLYNKNVNNYDEQAIIMIDLLTPDVTENNTILSPAYGAAGSSYLDGRFFTFNYIYLNDNVLDIDYQGFYRLDDTQQELTVFKDKNDKSIIWITCNSQRLDLTNGTYQKDYNFCDNLYYYNQKFAIFLMDITEADSHIFKLPYNKDYEGGAVIKLKATMKDNTPLYEDIPVQR